MIRHTCEKCGAVLESSESMVGQKDTCPLCGHASVVTHESSRKVLIGVGIGAALVVGLAGILLTLAVSNDDPRRPQPDPADGLAAPGKRLSNYRTYTAPDSTFSVDVPRTHSVEVSKKQVRDPSGRVDDHTLYLWENGDTVLFQVAVSRIPGLDVDEVEASRLAENIIRKTMSGMNTRLVSLADVSRRAGRAKRAVGSGVHRGRSYRITVEAYLLGGRGYTAMVMVTGPDANAEASQLCRDRFFETFRPRLAAQWEDRGANHANTPHFPRPAIISAGRRLDVDMGGGTKMELVLIRPGKFTMGARPDEQGSYSYEKPHHTVTISKPFYIGVHEVTRGLFQAVMSPKSPRPKEPSKPQVLSWQEAARFCVVLSKQTGRSFRLPTEAEWEYACRAGTTTRYHFGDERAKLNAYAWCGKNSGDILHPVGQKLPNGWGLYGMHGNVTEWCSDWYGPYSPLVAADPRGPTSGSKRVARGGNCICYPNDCRSAKRRKFDPDYAGVTTGLRVVCDPK